MIVIDSEGREQRSLPLQKHNEVSRSDVMVIGDEGREQRS